MDKIYLGKIRSDIKASQSYNPEKDRLIILDERLYFSKHSWDCGWYWGFGYIGNRDLHTHSEVFISKLLWHNVDEVFYDHIFKNDKNFWAFKDLLKQAYSLKKTAEVYRYGGHCTTVEGVTDVIQSKDKAKQINEDLEKILNTLWNFLTQLQRG